MGVEKQDVLLRHLREIADVSVFVTRGAEYGPPNTEYTAGDIDLYQHVLHTNTPRTQEKPTRFNVGFSDFISSAVEKQGWLILEEK